MYRTNKLCYWTKAKAKDEKNTVPCERPLKEPTEEVSLERSHRLTSTLALSEKRSSIYISFWRVNMKGLKQNDRN